MITDRMTAKVLGLIVLALTVVIDTSSFIFARPETRQNPRFAVIVVIMSLPLLVISGLLFRKASKMPEERDG